VSRYKLSRSQKSVMVSDLYCGQVRVSGYMNHYKFVLSVGVIKNRDKLIDPTVRVRRSLFKDYFIIDWNFWDDNNIVRISSTLIRTNAM
jgi:hypothetical protein